MPVRPSKSSASSTAPALIFPARFWRQVDGGRALFGAEATWTDADIDRAVAGDGFLGTFRGRQCFIAKAEDGSSGGTRERQSYPAPPGTIPEESYLRGMDGLRIAFRVPGGSPAVGTLKVIDQEGVRLRITDISVHHRDPRKLIRWLDCDIPRSAWSKIEKASPDGENTELVIPGEPSF